jgi:hypothetical protein
MKDHPHSPASANRRSSERFAFNGRAKIHFGAGILPRDCTVVDISDGGIRAIAENLEVPETFTIIFGTGESRECRLAWRIGWEFGAQYIGRVGPTRKNYMVA